MQRLSPWHIRKCSGFFVFTFFLQSSNQPIFIFIFITSLLALCHIQSTNRPHSRSRTFLLLAGSKLKISHFLCLSISISILIPVKVANLISFKCRPCVLACGSRSVLVNQRTYRGQVRACVHLCGAVQIKCSLLTHFRGFGDAESRQLSVWGLFERMFESRSAGGSTCGL